MINKLFIKVLLLLEEAMIYVIKNNIPSRIRNDLIMYRHRTIDLICELKFKALKDLI